MNKQRMTLYIPACTERLHPRTFKLGVVYGVAQTHGIVLYNWVRKKKQPLMCVISFLNNHTQDTQEDVDKNIGCTLYVCAPCLVLPGTVVDNCLFLLCVGVANTGLGRGT